MSVLPRLGLNTSATETSLAHPTPTMDVLYVEARHASPGLHNYDNFLSSEQCGPHSMQQFTCLSTFYSFSLLGLKCLQGRFCWNGERRQTELQWDPGPEREGTGYAERNGSPHSSIGTRSQIFISWYGWYPVAQLIPGSIQQEQS